jgi:RND family efflux transporter MFP subunit
MEQTQDSFMRKSLHFLKRKKWWVIGAVVLVVIIVLFTRGGGDQQNGTFTVQRGEVVSQVSVTGTVEPSESIDLAFEGGGRLVRVSAEVGDKVYRGQILAELENSALVAQVAQAQATLDALERGARPEEIRAKELVLDSTQDTLLGYYENARNTIQDAYSKSSDAVRNKTDALFLYDESSAPQLTFTSTDSQASINAKINRARARDMLQAWGNEIMLLGSDPSHGQIEQALSQAEEHMNLVLTLLSNLQDTLDDPPGLDQTTLDSYKSNLNTARSNVVAAMGYVDTDQQNITAQTITVQKAENDLALTRAGSTQEQLDAQRAQVNYYQAQLNKTRIFAPFAGTVTRIQHDPGEIVSANSEVVSLIGAGGYTIKANVTESDIAKVKVGNTASVTLDAYGSDDVFEAIVAQVDIGATIIEGVATYKTTLQFTQSDERILPGLTADVDILYDRKDDVLYVPTRNIISRDGQKFVKQMKDEQVVEIQVEAGLRGSDGKTEIVSGISEGDTILTD